MSRLWVDANVLLRFLTGDPEPLARRAAELMERAERGEVTLRVIELARRERVDLVDAFLALDAAAQDESVCTLDRSDFKRLPVRWVEP